MKRKFTFFCLVFAFCVNVNTIHAQVNVQDSLALVDFYNSTNGSNWFNDFNWLTKKPVSTWYGITVMNGRVTGINLYQNFVSGSLPSSIGNLVKLKILALSGNYMSGNIASSIGNLSNLTYLDLGDNGGLSGGIPSSLGNLINLDTLYLGRNNLSGTLPASLGNLQHLVDCWLDFNQLSGSIPSSFGNLVNLTRLVLLKNQLTGSIPSSLGNLVNLTNLNLSDNQLTGHIPSSVGNLVNMQDLELGGNQLGGNIPPSLGNLVNLRVLFLNRNKLTGSIPSSFGNLINLHYLYLFKNRLSGSIPSSLKNLGKLENGQLNLSSNRFTFDGMELIAQTFPNIAIYAPQQLITIHQNGNHLSVSAGGTLSNNTYTWFFKQGQINNTIIIKGDSVFHPTQTGTYRVKVTNSIATKLILHSDTIVYTAPSIAISSTNALQRDDKTNVFNVYPNPAKDVLFVETKGKASFSLLDQSGKILLTENINGKGSINISGRAAGLYYLKNNSSGSVQKVIIAR